MIWQRPSSTRQHSYGMKKFLHKWLTHPIADVGKTPTAYRHEPDLATTVKWVQWGFIHSECAQAGLHFGPLQNVAVYKWVAVVWCTCIQETIYMCHIKALNLPRAISRWQVKQPSKGVLDSFATNNRSRSLPYLIQLQLATFSWLCSSLWIA